MQELGTLERRRALFRQYDKVDVLLAAAERGLDLLPTLKTGISQRHGTTSLRSFHERLRLLIVLDCFLEVEIALNMVNHDTLRVHEARRGLRAQSLQIV